MEKKITPYQRLLDDFRAFIRSVKYPRKVDMFFWNADNLNDQNAWRLDDVYQRTLAAQSLGYEVVIKADSNRMLMYYRKLPNYSSLPWKLKD